MKWFSGMYDALTQRRFEEALDENSLDEALSIIEKLPLGQNLLECIDKNFGRRL